MSFGEDRDFVVGQNESGTLRMLHIDECECDPKKLVKVLQNDGNPITARFIAGVIAETMNSKSNRIELPICLASG